MTVIGLTGGIASGKSTVSAYLRQKKLPVFDADACVHRLQQKGSPCLEEMINAFGKEILRKDGELDRGKMAELAFHDPKILHQMNAIVQGAAARERDIFLQEHKNDPVVILDVPLLLESGWDEKTDQVWLVFIPEEEQIRRAMVRSGMRREEVAARMQRQWPLAKKKEYADVVLDNSGSLAALYAQVDQALEALFKNS